MNIKNYLHLYKGCEMVTYFCGKPYVKTLSCVIGSRAIYNCSDADEFDMAASWDMDYTEEPDKPILRQLSDMTEEEFSKVVSLRFYPNEEMFNEVVDRIEKLPKQAKHDAKYGTSIPFIGYDNNGKPYMQGTFSKDSLNPTQFSFLLSKHFDLFGLIEAGLAIDKTKEEAK